MGSREGLGESAEAPESPPIESRGNPEPGEPVPSPPPPPLAEQVPCAGAVLIAEWAVGDAHDPSCACQTCSVLAPRYVRAAR